MSVRATDRARSLPGLRTRHRTATKQNEGKAKTQKYVRFRETSYFSPWSRLARDAVLNPPMERRQRLR